MYNVEMMGRFLQIWHKLLIQLKVSLTLSRRATYLSSMEIKSTNITCATGSIGVEIANVCGSFGWLKTIRCHILCSSVALNKSNQTQLSSGDLEDVRTNAILLVAREWVLLAFWEIILNFEVGHRTPFQTLIFFEFLQTIIFIKLHFNKFRSAMFVTGLLNVTLTYSESNFPLQVRIIWLFQYAIVFVWHSDLCSVEYIIYWNAELIESIWRI